MNEGENPMLPIDAAPPRRRFCLKCFVGSAVIIFVTLSIGWFALASRAPSDFPSGLVMEIPYGAGLRTVARTLAEQRVIRSPFAFLVLARSTGVEKKISAGTYLFDSPMTLFAVVDKLASGEHDVERLRITLPEGTSVAGMGRAFVATLPSFNGAEFAALTQGSEGYLFPDTYFFFSNATSGPIVETLKANFLKKTDALYNEALAGGKSWSDIIIMASIIEEEAATPKDRRIVSGILWKRMERGMLLGVDAPFAYDIGKTSAALTTEDLQVDSPYNTYRHKGLPPTPISNPGLDAIDAALHPETSLYYYYLSDKAGTIHYAKTFDEHKVNKEKYLR